LRIKKFKLEVIKKAWLICDRNKKFKKSKDQNRRHTNNRLIDCSFSLIAQRREDDFIVWFLKIINLAHNHDFNFVDSHFILRKLIMTSEIKSQISRQIAVQITSFKIIFSLRIFDSVAKMNTKNSENLTITSLFKTRNIYNVKTQIRREQLRSLTSIQTLIRKFEKTDWTYAMQKNDENKVIHLFFMKQSSKILLKSNHEILVMNCTYKINKYKMSFLIINDQTVLHFNFFVTFCFMIKETSADYFWILQQLKTIYLKLNFSNSIVIITDMKKELMTIISLNFENFSHLLCIWHINKNVLINCKKEFDNKKNWNRFFIEWKNVIYASSEAKFWKLWKRFFIKYSFKRNCVQYLVFIYIANCRHFAKCFIDKILHFETTSTSRDEDEHVVLKKQLSFSFDDLKIVIDEINLLLTNELHDYLLKLKDNKIRFSMHLNKSIYSQIVVYVSRHAIKKINTQYNLLTNWSTALSRCIEIFIIIIDLFCSHKIQQRMYENERLLMKNVHFHWR
jgi:hypothetical protein